LSNFFAHAVREELWSRGRLLESRLSHGAADGALVIEARDVRDDTLVAAAEEQLARLRDAMPEDALVRLVAEAGTEGVSATMTVRIGPYSIVTDAEHVAEDVALIRKGRAATGVAALQTPLVWRNGTAAILLHEAHGHPLEHGHAPLALPEWLAVDVPMRMRRATFRDVPLLRMERVVVTQKNAPFALPDDRIEIELVDGGAYEPLTGVITIHVAASSIGPFDIVEPRESIVFIGAHGEPQRYPGVICSREGQELVVGSRAPVLITEWR
jgi:hypothetical protein